jgi:predicted ester cyclase
MTVLNVVSDCDYVSVHWEGTGTNTGEGNGIPATGRSIRVRGMTLSRLTDGQIIEEWTSFDQYAFLKQLGLIQN